MSIPQAGDHAPEVALPDEHGTIHRLSDRRGGWTVLYFYPEDDTPGCTIEACEFRDANETIHERARSLGREPARSQEPSRVPREVRPAVHAALRRGPRRRRGVRLVGAQGELRQVVLGDGRTTFLVDPDGRIARTWPKVKADGHAADVLAALDELQTARAR